MTIITCLFKTCFVLSESSHVELLVRNGQSCSEIFVLNFYLKIQLVRNQFPNVVLQTADLWRRKRPLYQLSHSDLKS